MKPETREWVTIAEQDIGSATTLLRDGFLENATYFCQQALEKLLKGILTELEREARKVHDLVELADLAGVDVTLEQRTFLTRLSDQARRSRYPGAEYNEDDVRELFEETERFYQWLRAKLT